ncbi:MAG TPA: DUF4493 domain-containing protein [Candidatus Alistipes avistercoris]|uniref:DUF4493 domain-containing protein n=1 Tax=uncultured Alistipes sp. TaxID=538949 RepID=UPI001F8F2B04|nr:DUF4493 domain-containing protein [uncultured Alistipes sp.]HIX97271.1 DUF4493 domain-containing protein [Candidatus Alistipes avistercoris]
MKLLYQILAAGTLAMLATGCKDETPNYGQTGGGSSETVGYVDLNGLSPQVLLDAEINQTPAQTTAAQTRAVTEATPDYLVRIYNSSDECVLDTTYGDMQSQFNDGPEQNLLALPVGTYRLEVHSQEPSSVPDVEWEAPTYGTTYDFAVLRSHTSDSPLTIADEVVCKLSNIKVTVSISADLAELLGDDTKSTVTLGSAVAEFTKSESRAAYFRPQNSDGDTLEFKLTGTKDGKPAELSKTITGVKAGQWRKIMLSIVYAETGDIKIVVTVDSFVQDSEITINSTESLWEPELDEGTDRPTLTWPGHDLAQPVALDESMYDPSGTFNGTAPALTLSAADGIQTLLLGITSDNAAFRTEIIEAAGLTNVDLCGTISRLHPFYGLQVTAGATEATIDLKSIMYLFFGYEGSHTLTFNMTDNKGRNAVATLQFNYGKGTAEEDPSIVCRQFDIDQPHTTQTGDEIDVDIKTASGIQAFVVSIISETLNEEVLAAVGLRPTFDLCNITDPEELAALTSDDIGFPVNDDVKGQTSMTFSVTKFTGMLSAFPGTHQFKLAVTNAEGSTTTKTLQLIVEQ